MSNENNKMQVDIENLFKQNVNDLSSIKELYRRIEELGEKITQVKYIDITLVKKLKKEYEKLKKIILDENIQVKLNNDIETINKKLTNDIETINSELETIAKVGNSDKINSLLINSKRVILPKGVYNIDITMPKGTTLIGDGEDTWVKGNLIVDSNCTVENLKIGTKGKSCTLSNNAKNVNFNNVTFTGGVNNSQGSFWINDKNVSDIKFVNCKFINGEYNGVTLVDKGTGETHIDSITFDNCYFKDNKRMNLECLVRKGANDIVSGYKNITLKNSTFIKNVDGDDTNINVSFDSNSLTNDSAIKEGGYSIIDNCYIKGGTYSLEIAGATNMTVVNNKIYPYSNTTNIISISGLKNIENKLIFNNNKIYGFKDISYEGYFNNIVSNYIECNTLIFRDNHYSNISNNTIISNKTGIPINLENSSNNKISDNTIKCPNATYIFGLYYPQNMYNNIFNNKIDTDTNNIYQYNLESPKLDNIWNNYNNKGLIIADLIRIKNRTSFSTNNELFKLKITENTTQPEIFVKCKWFGRYNNDPIGGEILLNFGTYNKKGALPVITTTGTPVSVKVSNIDNNYTYVISTTSNSTAHCMIEILASDTNIDLIDTV